MKDKSQNSADDEEAERLQGLKETVVEQNENRTEKLGTAEKEIDLFEHQIDFASGAENSKRSILG